MLSRGHRNGRTGDGCSAGVAPPAGFYFRVLEEGDVGAGDEVTKVADGPEHITVANMDALLYLPNPSRYQLESSLRVPALSPGWKSSLRALAEQQTSEGGNPGLKASIGPR